MRHPKSIVIDDRVNMFLKRVCFRVLEIIFSSINQAAHKATNLYQKYLRIKSLCQKLLSEQN
jgi:hypothetical protein